MLAYVIRRIVFGVAVLIGTSLITFVIAFVIPADPAVAVAGAKADPATLAAIRGELGLDRPLYFSTRATSAARCMATSAARTSGARMSPASS
jgi:ABC-type dipeptide/oligopeptide/nickel transport system permease component